MKDKLCRICWNSSGWRMPTGEASKLEVGETYVTKNGFGHEEWLFNYEWLLHGERHAFLQPIAKYFDKYEGEKLDILLYTFDPAKTPLLVATIRGAHVLTKQEWETTARELRSQGWLDQMQKDLVRIGVDATALEDPSPGALANVRFSPETVELFDPMPLASDSLSLKLKHRYHPYDWDGSTKKLARPITPNFKNTKRSERGRTRSGYTGSFYEPQHIKLQNALFDQLCKLLGKDNVWYERDFVDLSYKSAEQTAFVEIKIENSAKRCIRTAIGQLLEYAHYPSERKASKLVVVGDAPRNMSDIAYCEFLREKIGIPVHYWQFSWDSKSVRNLEDEI